MVDFRKKLNQNLPQIKINPIEIYESLDRKSETGPLRPIQEEILKDWFENLQTSKDVILKLHTGQGKTLIGLLILLSHLNKKKEPCLYVCPNIQLVKQTCEQAEKFGIPYTTFKNNETELPNDFINGRKILICHVQKVFNGLTKFGIGRNSFKVSAIVLDDSHACIESIKDAFTIKFNKTNSAYSEIVTQFEEDLKFQGVAAFLDIQNGSFDSLLAVPYWAWFDKHEKIIEILLNHKDDQEVKFKWPLLRDVLKYCQCYVSANSIEISPYVNPIHQFGTFHNAGQRVLMSATTMNDSFFHKGFRA